MLTQDQIKELFDYQDGFLIYKNNGLRTKVGQKVGWKNGNGYLRTDINMKKFYVHRLIWMFFYGDPSDKLVDHIDRDKSNNRIENLRLVDKSLNGLNRHKARSDSTTGLIGVLSGKTRKGTNQFTAKLTVNGNTVFQKTFKTAVEAHNAYLNAKTQQGLI